MKKKPKQTLVDWQKWLAENVPVLRRKGEHIVFRKRGKSRRKAMSTNDGRRRGAVLGGLRTAAKRAHKRRDYKRRNALLSRYDNARLGRGS